MSSLLPVSYVGSSTTVSSCAFDEEFVDFEAHQYSVVSDEWAISELDVEALGITKEATEPTGKTRNLIIRRHLTECEFEFGPGRNKGRTKMGLNLTASL